MSAILGALVGVGGVLAFTVAGCSGDDSVNPDAGDSAADVTMKKDGGGPKKDAGDANKPQDVLSESESDAITDGGSDTGPSFDAKALYAFPTQVNQAYCQRLAFCCDGPDAAAFQSKECVYELLPGGYLNTSLGLVDSGHRDFDPTQAAACLAAISAQPCGTVTEAELASQITACGQAMTGKLTIGASGCTSAWDCAPPAFCNNLDGGTGTCKALVTAGQPCGDFNLSTDCSELGNGHPADYCSQDSGTCAAEFGNGTPCVEYFQCQSQICDNATSTCLASTVFSDPGVPDGVCAFYNTPVDGGS